MNPYKGLIVLVIGIHSNGSSEHPGMVTRVWELKPPDVQRLNVTVFTDDSHPTPRPHVAYYESLKAANEAQAKMPFCYPAQPPTN